MSLSEPSGPAGFFEHSNWGGNLTPDAPEVLPRLQRAAIADALRRLPEDELATALRSKIVPMVTLPGLRLYAAFGAAAKQSAADGGLRLIAEGTSADFLAASREALGASLLRHATFDLSHRFPLHSAITRFSDAQAAILLVFLDVCDTCNCSWRLPGHCSWPWDWWAAWCSWRSSRCGF